MTPIPPGPGLDTLIAERVVMSNKIDLAFVEAVDPVSKTVTIQTRFEYPPYSTDIRCAWEVVEKMKEKTNTFHLVYMPVDQTWDARFRVLKETDPRDGWEETAPHAICLAALKAVGK